MRTSDATILKARSLRVEALELCESAAGLWQAIQRQQGSRPLRRVHWLARGASDGEPETFERRCPHCQGEAVKGTGHAMAGGGMIRVVYGCESCKRRFVFVRKPVDFGPPPHPTAAS
jgi:hypothetical protein